jgi:thymidylate synthase (FAD)
MKILDHGYIECVERWGSDERIIEAARMSTDRGFHGWGPCCESCAARGLKVLADLDGLSCERCGGKLTPGDEKLLAFLYSNKHMTPFEMAGMTIEVQAPIFVFREWHRHRTQSYNELSARYTPLPDVNYVPSVERLMINAGTTNKQAGTVKDANVMTSETAHWFRGQLERSFREAQDLYDKALKSGVPKELARVHLPVGRYSRMRASANLRNWLAFLTLRDDKNAQWEIRQYAAALSTMIAEHFPRTHALYVERRG